jgi:asparagine synthase (glutamine-hydrolysing)
VLSKSLLEALKEDDPFASARRAVFDKKLPDKLAELLYTDFTMYLQDNLLTKVDRASMLASLEARAPFLDHELAEYVAGLPSHFKLRGTTSKAILRRAVRHMLPTDILKRRKRGFNIPLSRWLLHGLGEQLRKRFSEERVRARGLFNPSGVSELLEEHLSQRSDNRKAIYTLLAFDLWCDNIFGKGQPVPVGEKRVSSHVSARRF